MTAPTIDAEPACPGAPAARSETPSADTPASTRLRAERRALAGIPRETWDELARRNPWSTPFSSWAFQRAWWDAYGDNAHEEVLVVCSDGPGSGEPVAIVPFMHRHEVEPSDLDLGVIHGRALVI